MISLTCSGLRIGVVSEEVAPSCSVVAAIIFHRVLPFFSISSDPIVVGIGALSSVKALSNPSPSDERSRFSARVSMSFSLLVSVLSVCYVLLG